MIIIVCRRASCHIVYTLLNAHSFFHLFAVSLDTFENV